VSDAGVPGLAAIVPSKPAQPIGEIDARPVEPWPSGVGELDRVLGGGIVPGSVILLAGEPGVGKSTLVLDVAARAALEGRTVLYSTGEESACQVRLRAGRIGALAPGLLLAALTDLGEVVAEIERVKPDLLVIDSIQTLGAAQIEGTPGGVAHIRAVTAALVREAKARDMAAIVIGHVTKDGSVAGPRTLEHLVDVVLTFEGDPGTALRMLRASKNRYGPADEVGCFEMAEQGIREVPDPSGLFIGTGLAGVAGSDDGTAGGASGVSGSCLGIAMEGRRPLAVEVQSLVAPSVLASPRRTTSGVDGARLAMVLAVLQRRCGVSLANQDVYVSTVGGARVHEPALDLAMALACASGRWDVPIPAGTVAVGEVGLAGEVRPVHGMARRLAEAARLGAHRAVAPVGTAASVAVDPALDLVEAPDVRTAARRALEAAACAA
jgi:DNA repair protein RadA/Sms